MKPSQSRNNPKSNNKSNSVLIFLLLFIFILAMLFWIVFRKTQFLFILLIPIVLFMAAKIWMAETNEERANFGFQSLYVLLPAFGLISYAGTGEGWMLVLALFSPFASIFIINYLIHPYYLWGVRASLKKGDEARAMREISQVIRMHPNSTRAYLFRAALYMNRLQFIEAEHDYRRALRISPNSLHAHLDLSYILVLEGRFDEARKLYRNALGIQSWRGMTYYCLGNLYYHLGQYTDGLLLLEQGQEKRLDTRFQTLLCHFYQMKCLEKIGEIQKAEDKRKICLRYQDVADQIDGFGIELEGYPGTAFFARDREELNQLFGRTTEKAEPVQENGPDPTPDGFNN